MEVVIFILAVIALLFWLVLSKRKQSVKEIETSKKKKSKKKN